MSVSQNFPNIAPSLSLDFANVKALDPRITFARASSARYYDGKTVAKAEENLFLYSQEFDNAAWQQKIGGTITANTGDTTAPDGTSTAEVFTEDTNTSAHRVRAMNTSFVSGLPYVISVFAKKGTRNFFQIVTPSALATSFANFDLDTGIVGTVGSNITASITNAGNGWYRCVAVVTATSTATVDVSFALITSSSSARLESYTGTSSTLFLWGAQLEQRSSVTAYTPTTTQPITNYIPVLLTATDNVARFDHNPTTGESLGLLVEEQRTNLVLRSEEFSDAAWSKLDSSVVADTIVAPNGTLTGDALVENTATAAHQLFTSFSFVNGTTYTFSGYAKSNGRNFRMTFGSSAFTVGQIVNFDLSAGTGTVNFGTPTFSITPVGNGWYRCTITATATVTTSSLVSFVTLSGTSASYTGNGYSGIYIWGAQLEAGAFPTSYIPTVASQVTRSPDAASMTGANFSSWYNQAESTIFSDFVVLSQITSAARTTASINDNSSNNRFTTAVIDSVGARFTPLRNTAGAGLLFTPAPSNLANNTITGNKMALAVANYDVAMCGNGGTVATAATYQVPVVNQMQIGNQLNGSFLNGTIRKLSYYPKRLTNAQLQAITG